MSIADLSRRHFILAAAATAVGFAGLERHAAGGGIAGLLPISSGYGPLVADPRRLLDLPAGFTYAIIGRAGTPMDDGLLLPGKPDGMAAFRVHGGGQSLCVIVRNHELDPNSWNESPFGPDQALLRKLPADVRSRLFDGGFGYTPGLGGTTTAYLDLADPAHPKVIRQFLSLAGTVRNCAGGPTPWGSWISCEESTIGVGPNTERNHGYNFEVPAEAVELLPARPLEAMGRFNHEAVAVDPRTGIVYQTEDEHEGLIYRFIPTTPGKLHEGGRLQALVVKDRPSFDSRNWEMQTVRVGEPLHVAWMDVDRPDNPAADLRFREHDRGACRFARGEGMWYGDTGSGPCVYFACTNGGPAKKGQIWRYVPGEHEGTDRDAESPGTLTLFAEPNSGEVVDNADNLTVAPWGDLVVCEDGGGEQFVRGVTPEGKLYTLARNAGQPSEFAGVCFDPSGRVMLINMQQLGLTLAITGPWETRA